MLRLFEEIKELGYTGSLNLPYRYIIQGRVEADRPAISPRHLTRYLLTDPDQLQDHQRELLETLRAACPETTALAGLVGSFAALLTPADAQAVLVVHRYMSRTLGPAAGTAEQFLLMLTGRGAEVTAGVSY